jgi:hypothetical protein
MQDNSIIIIGAGFAGLSAGIYAQMNGYPTQIFEMHDLPGGLCTAWKRKGYTIDGCIHWLVGSSPRSGMYRYWEEVGIAQGRQFINMDEYARFEAADGRTLIFYTDLDRLEKHMLEFSPQDAEATREFIQGIRVWLDFDQPSPSAPLLKRLGQGLKLGLLLVTRGREMQKWMKITAAEFVTRFKDPVMREALLEMWLPEFSMFFMLITFAYLHNKNAGYPIGGSLPMSKALAGRYLDLGGAIHYNSRVEKILVGGDQAVGVRLADVATPLTFERCHTRCRSSGVEPAIRLILVKPPHTWISPLPRDELLKWVIQISKRTVQKYLTEVSQSSPQAVRPGPAAGAGRALHDRRWQVHLECQIIIHHGQGLYPRRGCGPGLRLRRAQSRQLGLKAHGVAILNETAAMERGGNSTPASPFCTLTALNGWLRTFPGCS